MENRAIKKANKSEKLTNSDWLKLSVFLIVLLITISNIAVYAKDFVVDKAASKVKWEAKKVTGKHTGSISFDNGSISASGSKISAGSFVIDMKTIVDEDLTDPGYNKKLIGHLSSDDFFSIEKFPQSSMVIKKVTPVSGDESKFLADFTVKGITKPIEFNAKVTVNGNQLNAEGVITVNRTLFGIKYGSGSFFQGLGDKMIYDDFTLTFNIVALNE
ncbi:MAG: YceI family protein [Mariniphaga sp.]